MSTHAGEGSLSGTRSPEDLPMAPARWDRIQELLLGALEIPEGGRQEFLSGACDGDEVLRLEVESLLAAHSATGPVDRLADTLGARVLAEFVEGGDLEGEAVGRYQIGERLGQGGMSVVYRAWDPKLEREVALKFLPALLSSDQASRERLLVEAQVAAGLEHPNICTIHEIGEAEDGRWFIAMPLYEGATLRAELESGSLREEEAVQLALQVARGLARAHERGVVHRDIKPGNLVITRDRTLKILDFGIAQLEGAPDPMGQTPGTAHYMSPEQIGGLELDARTDLWSLGVVLYEMLTGHRPFEGTTRDEVRRAVLEEHYTPIDRLNPDISPELCTLVASLLQKDPARRPQATRDVEEELRRLRGEGRAAATPRHGLAWAAGLIAISLLTLAVFYSNVRSLDRPEATSTTTDASIAVLPFRNLTGDPSSAELATGLHAALVTQLSTIDGLSSISSSSLREYGSTTKSVEEIAGELGVETVLDGRVHDTDGRIVVSARLLAGATGRDLWAEPYERELNAESLYSIQREIGDRITTALDIRLTAAQQGRFDTPPTQDVDAYEYYVRGHAILSGPPAGAESGDAIRLAESMFRSAVRLDSTFALAWAALANLHSAVTGERALTRAIHLRSGPREQAAADTALREAILHGPDLPETLTARGWHAAAVENDREKALEHFEAALRLQPSDPDLLGAIGLIQISQGKWDTGVAYLQRALRLDPRSYWRAALLGQMYTHLRKYDEAERLFDQALAAAPTYADGYIGKAIVRLKRNADVQGAEGTLRAASPTVDRGEIVYRMVQPLAHSPFVRLLDGFFQAAIGDSSVADQLRERCRLCYWHLQAELASRRDDQAVARLYFDSAMTRYREIQEPGDNRTIRHVAVVGLGLGEVEDAKRYVSWAADFRTAGEEVSEYHRLESLAEVLVGLGDHGGAVETLRILLARPGLLSVPILEHDPLWDPLRDRPDFQALLEEYR